MKTSRPEGSGAGPAHPQSANTTNIRGKHRCIGAAIQASFSKTPKLVSALLKQSFLDKYADKLFYLSMLLGFLASIFAAAWKFMMRGASVPKTGTRFSRPAGSAGPGRYLGSVAQFII
jgi:hypothetical protein